MEEVEGRNNRGTEAGGGGRGNPPHNPYSGAADMAAPILPRYMAKMQRVIYIAISIYGLTYFNFFRALLKSPHIQHEWFQIGLALTVAILSLKAYLEMYEGKIRHREVNYENFRNLTHAAILLIGLATVAFNCALWPHYGWNTPFLLAIFFFGIIFQFLLLVPTSVQNVVGLMAFTFFLQEYSGYSNMVY